MTTRMERRFEKQCFNLFVFRLSFANVTEKGLKKDVELKLHFLVIQIFRDTKLMQPWLQLMLV